MRGAIFTSPLRSNQLHHIPVPSQTSKRFDRERGIDRKTSVIEEVLKKKNTNKQYLECKIESLRRSEIVKNDGTTEVNQVEPNLCEAGLWMRIQNFYWPDIDRILRYWKFDIKTATDFIFYSQNFVFFCVCRDNRSKLIYTVLFNKNIRLT